MKHIEESILQGIEFNPKAVSGTQTTFIKNV